MRCSACRQKDVQEYRITYQSGPADAFRSAGMLSDLKFDGKNGPEEILARGEKPAAKTSAATQKGESAD
jgi:hypothetical protein